MPFDKLSLKELKEHAKQHKDVIKGYTKMGKGDLAKMLKKHLKIDRKGEVSRKVSGGDLPVDEKIVHKMTGGTLKPENPALESQPLGANFQFRTQIPMQQRLQQLQGRIDKLKGGQLPSSIRERLQSLEMKIKGKGLTLGSDPATYSPSGKGITEECKKRPECQEPAPCKQLTKKAKLTAMDPTGPSNQMKASKCVKEERAKMGCPEKCTDGQGGSKIMKPISKVGDVLLKITDKTVAGLLVGGQPAFLGTCAAAGTALGGPPGGALSVAACKALYQKMMVEDAGSEEYIKKNLSGKEINLLNKMGEMGAKEGKSAAGAGVKSDDEGIDFEDVKWGSFTAQFDAYNRQHKKKFKDLMEFANFIRANKENFQAKTKKRADFYVNVLSKKKSQA